MQRQSEWKGVLRAMWHMGKILYKIFKAVVKCILQNLPSLGESGP